VIPPVRATMAKVWRSLSSMARFSFEMAAFCRIQF
jgi:hypothetical protein